MPEPIPVKNRPILFTDENNPDVWNAQRKGVDYDRLRKESKFWPKWYKEMNKTLVDHFPEAKFFDEKRWLWYGKSTPRPRDGILRCNTPYLLNSAGGIYENACYRGKWFLAPAHPEDSGCPTYMTPKDYADMEWYGRQITTMLRHHYCEMECPDGATFDAEKLARICSKQFHWPVSV